MAQDTIKDITKQNNYLLYNKTDKDIIKDTKQTIISLAYTDCLTKDDILELSDILLTISKYKTPNKKRGLK